MLFLLASYFLVLRDVVKTVTQSYLSGAFCLVIVQFQSTNYITVKLNSEKSLQTGEDSIPQACAHQQLCCMLHAVSVSRLVWPCQLTLCNIFFSCLLTLAETNSWCQHELMFLESSLCCSCVNENVCTFLSLTMHRNISYLAYGKLLVQEM